MLAATFVALRAYAPMVWFLRARAMGVTVGAARPTISVTLPLMVLPVTSPLQSASQTLPEASTVTWPDRPPVRPS